MPLSKKQKILIAIGLIVVLLVGLAFGFLLGKNDLPRKQLPKKEFYKSSCSFYINNSRGYEDFLTSDGLAEVNAFQLPESVLDLENIYDRIGREYTLSLDRRKDTYIYTLSVISENNENLNKVCEEAALLLLEEINNTAAGYSAKLIDQPRQSSVPFN